MAVPVLTEWLIQNVFVLVPVRKVHEYERGVRFWKGTAVREDLTAGIYWFVPFFGDIEVIPVKAQVKRLTSQSLMTTDGKNVVVKSNVRYSISKAWRAWVKVHDHEDTLVAQAEMCVAHIAKTISSDDLFERRESVEARVVEELRSKVKEWGVDIEEFSITDAAIARHYRMFGDFTNTK
jgi:regulator of protease activity HflC (stomatin/prohibitin superfamily)